MLRELLQRPSRSNSVIHRWVSFSRYGHLSPEDLEDLVDRLNAMRALDPEVVDAVWETIESMIPRPARNHPLGCHRRRIPDRLCFWGILIRLVTGCSLVTVEAILERRVSDTTLRSRRDKWIAAGVFDELRDHALDAYNRIIGLDLSEIAVDGSLHKAPCGGEETGKSPVDRAKLGWKWSVAADTKGIPLGWAIAGANRNDLKLLEPTLADVTRAGLIDEIETLHPKPRLRLPQDPSPARRPRTRRPQHSTAHPTWFWSAETAYASRVRWVVEGTNSWWPNYGQLRRNTDRRNRHRHAQLCLVTTILITAKLIDWRDR